MQPPLGLWDPLGLLQNADQEAFKLYRKIEIKHGCVAMLAVLGHIVTTAGVRLPGELMGLPFASIKNEFAGLEQIPAGGLILMFFLLVYLITLTDKTRLSRFI